MIAEFTRIFAKEMPKLVIIEGAGHALNRECPKVLAGKILENV